MGKGSDGGTNRDWSNSRKSFDKKVILSFALMIVLGAGTISNVFMYASGQNSASTSEQPGNSTGTNDNGGYGNSTSSAPEEASSSSNTTSSDTSNATNAAPQYQNETSAVGSNSTVSEEAGPVSNVTTSEVLGRPDSVTISGEPLVPSAGGITRSFSYPALLFEGDIVSEVEVTMTWNLDGTIIAKDNRGYELGLRVPPSQGTVTLFTNSSVVDQRVTSSDLQYDIYWIPVENPSGYIDRYEFVMAGVSENASSVVLDIVNSDALSSAKVDDDTLAIGNVDVNNSKNVDNPVSDANSDGLLLDWSDAIASGVEVSYDSAKSELTFPVKENSSFFIDPYIVATTNWHISPSKAHAFDDQLRLFTTSNGTASRINAFYYDGSNIVYKTSDDKGVTWSSPISLSTGAIASTIERWTITPSTSGNGQDYIHLFYWTKSGSTTTIWTKRGEVNGLAIIWGSVVQISTITNNESCSPGTCAAATATSDVNGTIYAAFSWNTTSGSFSLVIKKSTDNGLTWSDSLSQINDVAQNNIAMSLTELESPKVLFVYGKGPSADLFYRIFNGTVWGAEQTITNNGMQAWTRKQLSSIYNEPDSKTYVAYTNVTTTSGGILKVARFFGNGTFDSLETADSMLRHYNPNILPVLGADITINTISDNKIYNTRKFNGTWTSPSNPYGTSFNNPDDLTAVTVLEGSQGALWQEGASAPFTIKFGIVEWDEDEDPYWAPSEDVGGGGVGAQARGAGPNTRGDFNGDGEDDLAIGVPGEDVGTISSAGAVNVLYGSPSGLQTSSPADQFWHQNVAGVDDTSEAHDHFGASLAAGDFDGDGYSDLAIGVPDEDLDGIIDAGAVNVLYGSPSGLTTVDDFWHQNSAGVINFAEKQDFFGDVLGTGDFNGDGYDDLAIGVPDEETGPVANAGAVNVLYGFPSGLQASSPNDDFWHQDTTGVDGTESTHDQFGHALLGADFDGDGYDDLAIGVDDDEINGINGAGAVNVLYGSSEGLITSGDDLWHQDSTGVEDNPEVGEAFGESLSAGDFDGDGYDDLAIAIQFESVNGNNQAGAVYVIYGTSTGLSTSEDDFWHQDVSGIADAVEPLDLFGTSVVGGDFNNDGYDDLAIGVREGLEPEFLTPEGAVHILYGSPSGLQTSSPADQFWTQDSPGVDGVAEDNDLFGVRLSRGDYNNNGGDDLALYVDGDGISGVVQILYGSSFGLQTSSPADQWWTQDSPGVDDFDESGDSFGVTMN